jgi:acyl-coenzyme A thioesterase PaaI-like protein
MKPETHLRIDPALCGAPIGIGEGTAHVALDTSPSMAADDRGLVHGGFVFGLADYAAMLAVNHPNVVLGEAQVRFLRPVQVGARVEAAAKAGAAQGKRREVRVEARVGESLVLEGTFVCFVLERHVLDRSGDGR